MSTTKQQINRNGRFTWLCFIAIILILLAWAGGYHYGKRVTTGPISISERIVNGTGAPLPTSLTQFLTSSIKRSDAKKYCLPEGLAYSVLKQTGTQAKLFGRCNDSFPIDAIIVNDHWTLPSITDNFPDYPIPLCDYVDKYAISSSIEPYCYTNIANEGMPTIVPNTIK
jgi:hypothetical protein